MNNEKKLFESKTNVRVLRNLCIADLAEVVSVTPAAPMPGPPKKTDDKSFFDVSMHVFICKLYIHTIFFFEEN